MTGESPPLPALVLKWAAEWHCLPSQALAEYEDHFTYLTHPVIRHCARAWGVKPSDVAREDVLWLARQMHIDEVQTNHAAAEMRRLSRQRIH